MDGKEAARFVRKVKALFPAPMDTEVEEHALRQFRRMDYDAALLALDQHRVQAQGKSFFINEFARCYESVQKRKPKVIAYRVHWRSNGYDLVSREVFTDLEEAERRAALVLGVAMTVDGRPARAAAAADARRTLADTEREVVRRAINAMRRDDRLSSDPISPRFTEWSDGLAIAVLEEIGRSAQAH